MSKSKYLLLLFIGVMIIALGVVFGVKIIRESPLLGNYGNTDYVKPFIIQGSCTPSAFGTIDCR